MNYLYDASGARVKLGERIGHGGEGSVYRLEGRSGHWVAKVYHQQPSTEKLEKLLDMVAGFNDSLKQISAWPMTTLHTWNGGAICGFVMPQLVGHQPIHQLYNPGQRKQCYPNMDWAFLVHTARNIAAAFDVIHSQGHVIGDVNPNLVFVAANGLVKLIDCDSFQIAANGRHYLCEVAVPQFTPPELQAHSGFSGVLRTVNHDNFGLALLRFHLLLMGRHPYAGMYADVADLPLETAIQQFRYAYSYDNFSRKVSAPPACVMPSILSGQLAQLFVLAFTESGVQAAGRPTAKQWLQALDQLLLELVVCDKALRHRYFSGLPVCPWCRQLENFGTVYFLPRTPVVAVASGNSVPENSVLRRPYLTKKSMAVSYQTQQSVAHKTGNTTAYNIGAASSATSGASGHGLRITRIISKMWSCLVWLLMSVFLVGLYIAYIDISSSEAVAKHLSDPVPVQKIPKASQPRIVNFGSPAAKQTQLSETESNINQTPQAMKQKESGVLKINPVNEPAKSVQPSKKQQTGGDKLTCDITNINCKIKQLKLAEKKEQAKLLREFKKNFNATKMQKQNELSNVKVEPSITTNTQPLPTPEIAKPQPKQASVQRLPEAYLRWMKANVHFENAW